MACERTKKLDTGDAFPDMQFPLLSGGQLRLPRDACGRWMVFLGYRGYRFPFCRKQLSDFEDHNREFEKRGVMVIAVSSQNREDSEKSRELSKVTFTVGYDLDPREFSRMTGAFYNRGDHFIQATAFIVDPDGIIRGSIYSSGGIGRYTAEGTLRRLDQLMTAR
ncbi:MAG: peroxiredoxin family protein [Candidatus Zixiibacteriota bacterium]|jgi:peroxiredoxin